MFRVVRITPEFKVIAEHLSQEDAQEVWKEYSWRDVDSAVTRYIIEEEC